MYEKSEKGMIQQEELRNYAFDDARLDGVSDQFQHFNNRLKHLAQVVNQNDVEETVNSFRLWADRYEQKIEQMGMNILDPELERRRLENNMQIHLNNVENQLSDKIRQKQKEMSGWQKRFGESLQTHLAEPEKKNVVWLAGIVLILLAVESIANSRFFAETSDLGLLGGTLAAITVSFGNVFVPLILAFFAHRWFYKPDFFKNVGIGIIVLFFLWVFGFNYLVAEYREELILEVGRNPSTLDYVLLFALGVIVGVISFWKMWTHYDPYQEARKCMNDLKEMRDNFSRTALQPLTRTRQQYDDQLSDMTVAPKEIVRILDDTRIYYSAASDNAIRDANKIISIYYGYYCIRKVDPDPPRPAVLTQDNAAQFGVGISIADWNLFETRNVRFNRFIDEDVKKWAEKIKEILHMIETIIERFMEPVLDILNELAPAPMTGVKAT